MFELTKHTDDIWFFENVFKDPSEIIKLIESDNSHWIDVYRRNNELLGKEIPIKDDNYPELLKEISNALNICFLQYIDSHNLSRKDNKLDIDIIPIRKQTGFCEGMSDHVDTPLANNKYGNKRIEFTVTCYFNEDFSGGEIVMTKESITIKPKPGSILIFPKNYTHSVNSILSGDRYASIIFALGSSE